MGRIPPKPPEPYRPLDLSRYDHREAYSRFEAEREVDSWLSGEDYRPVDMEMLSIYGNICVVDPYKVRRLSDIQALKDRYCRSLGITEARMAYAQSLHPRLKARNPIRDDGMYDPRNIAQEMFDPVNVSGNICGNGFAATKPKPKSRPRRF